jgi:hypothetical protein
MYVSNRMAWYFQRFSDAEVGRGQPVERRNQEFIAIVAGDVKREAGSLQPMQE